MSIIKMGETMSRPQRKRKVCRLPKFSKFGPENHSNQTVILNVDEYETIRLIDLESLTQQECAKQMGVARTTVQSIYEQARYKIAQCIVRGYSLKIEGGNYCFDDKVHLNNCMTHYTIKHNDKTEEKKMRIAVTHESGEVFQHFGKSKEFKVYEVVDNKIVSSEVKSTNGQGHSALGDVLKNLDADVLICGGIGGGARNILTSLNIEIIPGIIGNCDKAVNDYLKGELHYNPNTKCNHHDDGHHNCHSHDEKCCH